ncbi:unnamed protein product [Paramecium octaurelia]|uniref:Uncharacterized protein n=1 Tax=Paramecium octaurelia TaxID=43137 RepID=A0A8S1RXQ3_PAROT|nr:unnamed protein product [Paramecium octaurelia]
MKQKREEFRQQIRKQANEKIFSQVRGLINKSNQEQNQMVTTESEFFQELTLQIKKDFDEKSLLKILKKWEDNFDKKQLQILLFNQEFPYFKFLIANFKMTKKYIKILIFIFVAIEHDISEVHHALYQYQLLNQLQSNFEKVDQEMQQQIMFLFSVLVQYSQLYRLAIKNSNVMDIVVTQFINQKIDSFTQNYVECFLFMIWSLINPDISSMSDLFEWLFDCLLNLNAALVDFQSEYLLPIIFKAASQFTFCREKLFQKNMDQILNQLQSYNRNQTIYLEFLDFLNHLLMQQPDIFVEFFIQNCWNVIKQILTQSEFIQEAKIRSGYIILEAVNNREIEEYLKGQNILNEILNLILQTQNFDLIQVYFNLLQVLLIQEQCQQNQVDKLAQGIVHSVTLTTEIQLVQVWQVILYLMQDLENKEMLIDYLRKYNFRRIMENCLQIAQSSMISSIINRCFELL